jgi:colanic acid/amylovoran biosynthesis protein
MIGGSLFMQPREPTGIREKFVSVKSEWLFPDVPFVIMGANFGPYSHPDHYSEYLEWFSQVSDICFRDSYSFELFALLPHVRWAPDILFTYQIPPPRKQGKVISISCIYNDFRSGLPDYEQDLYTGFLSDIANQYIQLGYKINLVAFCIKQGDVIAARKIFSNVQDKSKAQIVEYIGNSGEFLDKFLEAEFIIGTRFHSIILGWSAMIPTFPIVYNLKTENALSDYCFKGNWSRIAELPLTTFEFIDTNRIERKGACLQGVFERAQKQFQYLDTMLS